MRVIGLCDFCGGLVLTFGVMSGALAAAGLVCVTTIAAVVVAYISPVDQ